jgi:S-adenosylmethionine-diacylglycerol 3-amino-3-carboxypropyl transferase
MRDLTFQAAFRRLFVYNILFEDSEVDGKYFGLNGESRVLGISAAGCGLASMLRFGPERIDAVDINGHHLALASLRMAAAQRLRSFEEFYALFGHGKVPDPAATIGSIVLELPTWIQKYWARHKDRFKHAFYDQGLTATMLRLLRSQVGVGAEWMQEFVTRSTSERVALVRTLFEPTLRRPVVGGLLNSPLQQLALGVNFSQKSRLMDDESGDLVDYFVRHCERVAATDCKTNWFAWYAMAGRYDHENPLAVPPYLRECEHARSSQVDTVSEFHHRSIFEVLASAERNTWTHYSLCDAVDWMPAPVQEHLLAEVLRTARPGARVLMRSVSDTDIVANTGFSHLMTRLDAESQSATAEERSRQYKRVDFYQVCA